MTSPKPRQPQFPELSTTSLPELFDDARKALQASIYSMVGIVNLRAIASRWHDPNCECRFKGAVEKEACLRCRNVRRMILERL